jgi:hypothetical protein
VPVKPGYDFGSGRFRPPSPQWELMVISAQATPTSSKQIWTLPTKMDGLVSVTRHAMM